MQAEQPLGNLISDSYIYAIQKAEGDDYIPVDVAVVPVGVIRASFDKGPVTVADAYEVSSLGIGEDGLSGYPLCSVWLTGAELKTLAEVDASVSVLMPAAQLYCSGLQYSFNPNRLILNRVTDVQLSTANGLQELENDRLYRVVAGMYSAQMLGTVNSKSFGLLKLDPKDAQGNSITDFSKTVIIGQDGREVKEWYALASYLQSFPAVDGVPTVPADYAAPQGRKQISDSTNLWELLKAPNHIAWIVYGVVAVLLALIALTVWLIVRSVKKKRQKKAAENIA